MPEMIAYFDCFSGASGDMLLGALLDAGLSLDDLRSDIAKLGLPGVELTLTPHLSHGISGSHFDVVDTAQDHPARNLESVRAILEPSDLPEDVVRDSLAVFGRLAAAEAKVHGVSIGQVHFHELGAVDSLVDIVGFCTGVRRLGITAIYASPLPLGSGRITTAHGLIPVPVPATLGLLAEAGAPTVPSAAESELVTPTGAALLTTLARFARPAMTVERVGYGFGTREMPWANMLRLWIGRSIDGPPHRHTHDQAVGHTHGSDAPHTHDDGSAQAHEHDHEGGHTDESTAHHTHAHPHPHAHSHTPGDGHSHD